MIEDILIKISVIIPTYKPAAYIQDCLLSLENQTLSKDKFEVIIILNGDKEPYYSDLLLFLKNCTINYNLIHTEKKGVSNARNLGIEKAKGDYIVFVDDDDVVSETFLEGLSEKSANNTIVVSNFKCFNGSIDDSFDDYLSNSFKRSYNDKKIKLLKIRSHFSSSCGKLIPVEVINGRTFNQKIEKGEDSLFMATISDRVKDIKLSDINSIYYRRIRSESASRKKRAFGYELNNCSILMLQYLKLYFSNPLRYNIMFIATRLLANIRNLLIQTLPTSK